MSQGQMIAGVGSVLLLISLFLDWVSGITVTSAAGLSLSVGGGSAFDVFSGMDIIMLIISVAGIAWAVATAVGQTAPPQSGWILGLLGVLVTGWCLGWVLENSNAGIGSWLGLVGAVALTYGAFEAGRHPVASEATPAA
jgi:hypothetical protein